MMKVGGIWCSPFEIESKLVEHPDVLEAAVVGRADANELVKPEAFVVLKHGRKGDDTLAAELPKMATGKIQRFLLRQSCGNPTREFGFDVRKNNSREPLGEDGRQRKGRLVS